MVSVEERFARFSDAPLQVESLLNSTVAAVAWRRRRRTRLVGTGLAAALLVGAGVATAMTQLDTKSGAPTASTPSPSPSVQSEAEWQMDNAGYQDRLLVEAERHDNYVGSALDYKARSIVLYGTGDAPEQVAQMMEDHPASMDAVWSTVPFTAAQLEGAANSLSREIEFVRGAEFGPPFDAVVLLVLERDRGRIDEVTRRAESLTNIPVVVRVGEPIVDGSQHR